MANNVSIKKNKINVPAQNGSNRDTFHIHLQGLVQGVGFRPFVYKLAKEFDIKGWVNNSNDGVHIEFNSDVTVSKQFYRNLILRSPVLSRITSHSFTKIKSQDFHSFEIIKSEKKGNANLMLTPDFAMCENCRNELNDAENFRYQYPFITCTHCGPRYSIITTLPYDRGNTTMQDFEMCKDCNDEYENPENIRHFSQANSCADCGIEMGMFDKSGEKILTGNSFPGSGYTPNDHIIHKIAAVLKDGKVIAVKGIGGFLLLCDANNEKTIKILRERKHRPTKPFAVMFPDLKSLKNFALLQKDEEAFLKSAISPIVLLEAKENTNEKICLKEIAPNLSKMGCMLPYAPLFELILTKFGKPVIATSANVSESPIIYKDKEALESLFSIADFIVTNNREIVVPQDDSVIRFSKLSRQKIILRRSRGLAPSYFNYESKNDETILATGALLKSTFTFVNNRNTYVSQYLGNTQSYEAQQTYSKTVQHFFDLFQKEPDVILTDKHPLYFSNQFAKELANNLNIKLREIQHHKAHFAGVLSENNLMQSQKNSDDVLGVIWDGTGLGEDGNIWGGEFFTYSCNQMKRNAHFDYFPFMLRDKMSREPRISALATCDKIPEVNARLTDSQKMLRNKNESFGQELLFNKFTLKEWELYQKMLQQPSLQCSSVGRIFDAVSSLLNLCDMQSFEGEAAMLLEERAYSYFTKNNWHIDEIYSIGSKNIISTSSLMKQIIDDIKNKRPAEFIAAKFHFSLVNLVKQVATKSAIKKIAFSGGVFLNGVLVDLLNLNLGKDFELYFHNDLSPNDENISFGQMVYYDQKIDQVFTSKVHQVKDLTKNRIKQYSQV